MSDLLVHKKTLQLSNASTCACFGCLVDKMTFLIIDQVIEMVLILLHWIVIAVFEVFLRLLTPWLPAALVMSASCSCGYLYVWAVREKIYGIHPLQPICLIFTHQKTLFTPVNISLMHFSQILQVPMNPFLYFTYNFTFSLNIPECRRAGTCLWWQPLL